MKAHRSGIVQRDREVPTRGAILVQREGAQTLKLEKRDGEIRELAARLAAARAEIPRVTEVREENSSCLLTEKG